MDVLLNAVEARVFGVLIEKQMATPDYYPMTLNALVNACNQKTNREPVMDLSPEQVEEALTRLRNNRWVWQVKAQGSRALKYEHNIAQIAEFSDRQAAILCILLLRGPQTVGELRARTVRLTVFHGLAAVEHSLQKLINHEKGAFVLRLDRRPGHKENRYAHLFSEVAMSDDEDFANSEMIHSVQEKDTEIDRMEALERKVNDLQVEIEELKVSFQQFKSQFE
jgi:uncharacterized protein YceH (UPF0502 family)